MPAAWNTAAAGGWPACAVAGGRHLLQPLPPAPVVASLRWTGDIPPQKWMKFYMKVLSRFATGPGLKLTVTVTVEVAPPDGVPASKVDEARVALRELGLAEELVKLMKGKS